MSLKSASILFWLAIIACVMSKSTVDARGHTGHTHTGGGTYTGPRGGVYTYDDRGQRRYSGGR
jgi:hypothetical protein